LNEALVEASLRDEPEGNTVVILHYSEQEKDVDFHVKDGEKIYKLLSQREI